MYYPILGYWLDIGKHEDFKKAKKILNILIVIKINVRRVK